MNPSATSEIFLRLDRVLWLVTAGTETSRGGLIATFVSQASLAREDPRVLVGLAKSHHTWGLVEANGTFGLHLLAEDQLGWVWRFGLRSGRDVDKFEGLSPRTGASGAPLLVDAAAWLDCRVESRLDTGDRTIYLAEVIDAFAAPDRPVLTAKRMLSLASEEQRRELRDQVLRDSEIDRRAIQTWRRANRSPGSGAGGS